MTSRTFKATSLVAFLGFSSATWAKQAQKPTLEEILERLDANLSHYDTRLPSLFCDEHVVSQVQPGLPDQDTITDSIFRLKRTPDPAHTTNLVESREIERVNGKPATSNDMDGPTLLSGAFEGGIAVVSDNQSSCMDFTLQTPKGTRPAEPYIVRFATVLTPRNSAACLLQEKSKGRVFIDPASMQITHLELTTPRHAVTLGDSSQVMAKRTLTVDYAPVVLGGETFWMPSTITQRVISGEGSFHPIVWSFRATYRNYHKLEVTSRMLPASGENTAP